MSFKDWIHGTLIAVGLVCVGASLVALIFYLMDWTVS